jgi:signal transduction histidine kinase
MEPISETVDAQNHMILIVDDNPANLSVVVDYLASHSFHIMVARDGETGLRLAQQDYPDLILLDVLLPGIDGFEVCRRLKANEQTRNIPVIFMTIVTRTEDKVRGFEVGGVDYITKPFQHEEVLARVTTHLRLRELTREVEVAKESLERRVTERTAELSQANVRLEEEIAERKQAEEALQKSETLLNATQRLSKVGGWQFDVASGKSFWTEELYRIHELPTNSDMDHVQESLKCYRLEDRPIITEVFRRAAEQGETYDLEFPFTTSKGRPLWIRTTAQPVYEAGKVVRVIGNLMDITERKQAEEEICRLNHDLEQRVVDRTAQLEAANKELEAFAYSISHDLRAPLRHIDGFIGMLQNKTAATLDDQSRHYTDVIAESARKMGTLIDDLLSFSRMGRNEISKAQIDLNELVRGVIQDSKPETEDRDIQWKIASLPVITGDRTMMRIVMNNLISNALKFTRPRKTAQIEIGCEMKNETEVVIFICDNGVGFDMNYVDKLFGVFQRLHRQEDFEGTGIGLANVRRVISRHGGMTWAEGEVDHGATFYFSLPTSK